MPEGLDGVIDQRTINMQASLAIMPGSLSADTVRCRRLDVNEKDSYLLPDPSYVSFVDDFIHGSGVASGTVGELGWNFYTDASSTLTAYTGEANHPGAVYITALGASGIGSLYANAAAYSLLNGVKEYRQVWWIRDPTTNVGDNDVRFGILDNVSYSAHTNAIYFELDASGGVSATNWVAQTTSASSATSTDTGVAWANAVYHKFEIWYTPAAVKFYINGALVATHTTNIPTTSDMQPCWSMQRVAANRNCVLDYYSMTMKVAR